MAEPGTVFLMYHELELAGRPLCQSEPGYVRYILPEESFRSQMMWLAQGQWRGLSVSEALEYPSAKSVAITFDDGSETDLISAAPILKESGFRATFYVTAGFVGRRGYLSPAQLRELRESGFEIGCHSMTHAYLDDLDAAGLRVEIVDAAKKLEQMIGEKVLHFSCPGGRFDERSLNLAREAGYRSFANSRTHANASGTDPYRLGRVAVLRGTDQTKFKSICTGQALWRIRSSDRVRDAAKRALGNTVYDRLRALMLK
jgi:peptidoglycan/xylan/chitin deacetylase (PgdA/CDA1 family)